MPDTPDTRQLRANALDLLDDQKLDAEDRTKKGAAVQNMNYAELVTTFPDLKTD